MSKKLIIAEKPSVAADIAKSIGGFTKQQDYYENDNYIISSAIGHLLEIHADSFDVKRGKWSLNNLPIIPPYFELNPIAKTESRLKLLLKLIKRKDVVQIINACDAGREGELIFKLIIQYAKSNKPLQRLWLQSMTPQSIRHGFENLKNDEEMQGLSDAARCRSEADWLVGINGTRAMTAFNSKDGGFFLTTVGRVQTPTLSLVVEREEKRKKFIIKPYWEIHATFISGEENYIGKWYNHKFNKPVHEHDKETRLFDKSQAEQIYNNCQLKITPIAFDETKPSSQNAPFLFDLTSLQREVNARFGLSAKNTLAIAQALYEKHKVITYPRTDSRHLPQDYLDTVKNTLNALNEQNNYSQFIKKALSGVKPNKRIFDDTKISDHFAIIPTSQLPKILSEIEQKVYDIIVRRFIAIFYPAAEYLITTRITKIGEEYFKTEGKVLTSAGWLSIYNKEQQQDVLCPIIAPLKTKDIELLEQHTNPPPRYNEATLLSAMEGAGKLLEDEELRQAMHSKGLGTPATRATIIEGLIYEKYILREGKEIIPTTKAFQLLTLLRGLGVDELSKAELTAEWEYKLAQIEQKKYSRTEFMQEIASITTNIVNRAKEYASDTIPGDYITLEHACPDCNNDIKENYRRFACINCEFSFTKTPAGRQLEIEEIKQLLLDKTIGPLQGFRSKQGRPFASILRLETENEHTKLKFDFGQNEEQSEVVDFTNQLPLGICPQCQGKVFEHGLRYVCEHAVGSNKTCSFTSSKIILQQEISNNEFKQLLQTGKTNLLTNFKSARTGRNFKAFLILTNGKITFEFENKTKTDKIAKTNKVNDSSKNKDTTIKQSIVKVKKDKKTNQPNQGAIKLAKIKNSKTLIDKKDKPPKADKIIKEVKKTLETKKPKKVSKAKSSKSAV